jgi:hypothetical protein
MMRLERVNAPQAEMKEDGHVCGRGHWNNPPEAGKRERWSVRFDESRGMHVNMIE